VVWRDKAGLPETLIFDYLGGHMPAFALNFSRPADVPMNTLSPEQPTLSSGAPPTKSPTGDFAMAIAKKHKFLSVTLIGLMTSAAVVTSLRGLPLLAKEEVTMFAYMGFTLIFYLVPTSLVSAEIGGAFADKKGGIYAWVSAAFGTPLADMELLLQ
jgi:hypothetical protein